MSFNEINLKFCLMGKGGVGKTSLVNRYVHQRFLKRYMQTLGEDIFSKKLAFEDKQIYIAIHDLAGQERFSPFRKTYLQGSQLGLAVFDITMPNTLKSLEDQWFVDLTAVLDPNTKFFLMVVGNKADLQKKVTDEDIQDFLNKIKRHYKNIELVDYLETSAKENLNVETAFKVLVQEFLIFNKII